MIRILGKIKTNKFFWITLSIVCVCLLLSALIIFNHTKKSVKRTVHIDLKQIKKRGKIIALTEFNSTSFFVYKGETMGFQYELLQQFAKHLHLELKIILCNDLSQTFDSLSNGKGDLIALNLNKTSQRQLTYGFTVPFANVRQVLVQRKPDNWGEMTKFKLKKSLIRNLSDLKNKTIYVQKKSSFYESLMKLRDSLKINFKIIDTNKSTEELISLISEKKIELTVCDENVGSVITGSFPLIDIETPLSKPLGLSWVVRKNSTELLNELNQWLKRFVKTTEYNFIYTKYYKVPDWIAQRRKTGFFSANSNRITCYDEIIKKYVGLIDWDWRLVASLIYEESHFNPDLVSSQGAIGLMQLAPCIANKYNIDSLSSPADNIRAGIKHLKELNDFFIKEIKEKDERIKFVLASYNTGVNNIYRARIRAKKYKMNPNIWDEQVEYFVFKVPDMKLLKDSTKKQMLPKYPFVRNILERYEHYKTIIKQD